MKLSSHFHLVPRLKMSEAVPLLPVYNFMAWTGKTSSVLPLLLLLLLLLLPPLLLLCYRTAVYGSDAVLSVRPRYNVSQVRPFSSVSHDGKLAGVERLTTALADAVNLVPKRLLECCPSTCESVLLLVFTVGLDVSNCGS